MDERKAHQNGVKQNVKRFCQKASHNLATVKLPNYLLNDQRKRSNFLDLFLFSLVEVARFSFMFHQNSLTIFATLLY